ncbi:MAG TPA: divergent PAP2 family protein [Dongiaceae bacterium]|nr:divergent PAP2 family protein [Dongiaceae bacterium]
MTTVISPYLIAIVAGWTISQLTKFVISLFRRKQLTFRGTMFVSGGMPSSHSATIMAVWTTILLLDGVNSGLFGLASAVALVVLYDAVKVRRSSGEQGVALTALLKKEGDTIPLPRVAMGHTPLEVAVGSLVGILVGLLICALHI